ncbi:MAG: arginase family protein [Thermococci archaeon]|nr:arginase family protein [Thermococci archaeon]
MVTFVLSGEEPYRDGVRYVARLLRRRGVLEPDEVVMVEASRRDLTAGRLPRDKLYVMGDHVGSYGVLKSLQGAPALVSLDAHTDLLHDYLDHGSWLAYAIEEGLVRRAAVMAPVLMIPTTRRTSLWTRNVRIYPALPRTYRTASGWKAYLSVGRGVERVVEDARRYLGPEVHLTVDLDVLRPEYGIARFQHGELTLEELMVLLRAIAEKFRITSCDMAEISSKVRKSKEGRNAVVEIFRFLRGVCR